MRQGGKGGKSPAAPVPRRGPLGLRAFHRACFAICLPFPFNPISTITPAQPRGERMPDLTACTHCGGELAPDRVLCAACGSPAPGAEPPTVPVEDFRTDCASCHALCCVALAFDWPNYKKPAGTPCKNLNADFTCGKWDNLEQDGYWACRGFDCHGAGQATAGAVERACGSNWRASPAVADFEFGTFQTVYATLHEEISGVHPPKRSVGGSGS